MSSRVPINPGILTWARERASLSIGSLAKKYPKLLDWEMGQEQPTLRQLEQFAKTVHVPIGYLFLSQPIQEVLPISDFRTLADREVARPSPNLLDTLYLCQQRQDWYSDHVRMYGLPTLTFIGSATLSEDPVGVANRMCDTTRLALSERQQLPNWTEALRQMIARVEESGILVMASSIVGSNSHRKLAVEEFRGFALADQWAPLIFLNAADSKSAQMFTLAHELAHLWLGESGISNTEAGRLPEQQIERWCNSVAAELLMPLSATLEAYQPDQTLSDELMRLARLFKVSTLVVLRRLFDAGFFSEIELWQHYHVELARIRSLERGGGGGDFYRTLGARTGKRFARAVLASTLEGQTLFQDAFRLLGVKKTATFYQAARELEVLHDLPA
ncbi:MAG: ImmA/IrrE family metallo-endopeptidase [Candidatus Sericytochromatia bacterium]|nr:ImmA/IrrE family metallo-endopeptidase [Candidatus Sericytochromatia bacterium]